jgi:hypothetical protein
MIDRTQSFVFLYFGFARIGLVVILLVDPTIYDGIMELTAGLRPLASLTYLGGIPVLIAVLGVPADLAVLLIAGVPRTPLPPRTNSSEFLLRPVPTSISRSGLFSAWYRSGSESWCSQDIVVQVPGRYSETG